VSSKRCGTLGKVSADFGTSGRGALAAAPANQKTHIHTNNHKEKTVETEAQNRIRLAFVACSQEESTHVYHARLGSVLTRELAENLGVASDAMIPMKVERKKS
jgi:hypothetical protein